MPTLALPPLTAPAGHAVAEPVAAGRPLRWGILATGRIARSFATDLALLDDHVVAAVGSRHLEPARAFASTFGGTAHGSYEEVLRDPDVDVVYVATPHAVHHANTMAALEAGKPVLVEKPMTLNGREAEELVATARERNLFLMEAMWMRCHPVVRRLRQLVADGSLGRVRQLQATLGFVVDRPATDRLLDPSLGAGALLDMGIYPLSLAQLVLGWPDRVHAEAVLSGTGIDLDVALTAAYATGALAVLTCSMTSFSPRTAWLATDLGLLDVPAPFHHPPELRWVSDGTTQTVREDVVGSGLAHEAQEVARCLRAGEVESPLVPLDDTLRMMRLMDGVRADIGVRYAADR